MGDTKVILITDIPRDNKYLYCVKGNPLTIIQVERSARSRGIKKK